MAKHVLRVTRTDGVICFDAGFEELFVGFILTTVCSFKD